MVKSQTTELSFKHLVDAPRAGCLFGSARDAKGKIRLFLISHQKGRIYSRNGIKGTWEELGDQDQGVVQSVLERALHDKNVPRYTTNQLSFQN